MPARKLELHLPLSPEELASFEPVIAPNTQPRAQRVQHPVFGAGVVIRSLDGGALEVDFGPKGVKRLIGEAVTLVDC